MGTDTQWANHRREHSWMRQPSPLLSLYVRLGAPIQHRKASNVPAYDAPHIFLPPPSFLASSSFRDMNHGDNTASGHRRSRNDIHAAGGLLHHTRGLHRPQHRVTRPARDHRNPVILRVLAARVPAVRSSQHGYRARILFSGGLSEWVHVRVHRARRRLGVRRAVLSEVRFLFSRPHAVICLLVYFC